MLNCLNVNEEKNLSMNQKAIVLLLFCCLAVAETMGVVFSQEKPPAADPDIVKQSSAVVLIPGDDEFYVGKEKVTRADIPEKVKQLLKDNPPDGQVVYVKARCPVKYGVVVSVIDSLREAGFKSIGLVTDKGNSAGESRVSGTKSTAGRDGNLPQRAAPGRGGILSPPARTGTILIEVESEALVKLNFEAMSLPGLQSALERLLNDRSDKTVFIKAPKEMIYCEVLKVVGIAKGAGAHPIGLQVDYLK